MHTAHINLYMVNSISKVLSNLTYMWYVYPSVSSQPSEMPLPRKTRVLGCTFINSCCVLCMATAPEKFKSIVVAVSSTEIPSLQPLLRCATSRQMRLGELLFHPLWDINIKQVTNMLNTIQRKLHLWPTSPRASPGHLADGASGSNKTKVMKGCHPSQCGVCVSHSRAGSIIKAKAGTHVDRTWCFIKDHHRRLNQHCKAGGRRCELKLACAAWVHEVFSCHATCTPNAYIVGPIKSPSAFDLLLLPGLISA